MIYVLLDQNTVLPMTNMTWGELFKFLYSLIFVLPVKKT